MAHFADALHSVSGARRRRRGGRGFASALARKRAGATIAAIREVGLHPCRGGNGDGGGGGGPVMIEADAPFMSPDKS